MNKPPPPPINVLAMALSAIEKYKTSVFKTLTFQTLCTFQCLAQLRDGGNPGQTLGNVVECKAYKEQSVSSVMYKRVPTVGKHISPCILEPANIPCMVNGY